MLLQIVPPNLARDIAAQMDVVWGVLVLYFLALGLVTYLARKGYTGSLADYVVASRSLGWVVVTFTIFATIFSGVGMAGFPGAVYIFGLPFVSSLVAGFSFLSVLLWFFGRRMWIVGNHHNFNTPGDLLGAYYQSDTVRVYTVVVSVLFNVLYLVAQFLAAGILINVLTGGAISPDLGMLIIAVVVGVHVTVAGISGIAWSDTFNGILILFMMIVFTLYIVRDAGSVGTVFTSPAIQDGLYLTLPGPKGLFTPLQVLVFGMVAVIGTSLVSPAVWIRIYAMKRRQDFIKIGAGMLILWTVAHVFGTAFSGIYGRTVFPSIENPDFVSSLLAFKVMPFGLATLFLVAVLAAIISTADSYVHVLSATVVRDLVKAIWLPELSERRELLLNYLVMGVATVAALVLAKYYAGLIVPLTMLVVGIALQLFLPLVGAVAWPRASTEAALISPPVGVLLLTGFQLQWIPNPYPSPFAPGLVMSFVGNAVVFCCVSYLSRPQPLEVIDDFHGVIARKLDG